MSIITVGPTGMFSDIPDAVAAAASGDTVQVQSGTYTDQFITIRQSITLQAVNGQVLLRETHAPPDGKAMITESGAHVAINGFDIAGVSVPDRNGAAIRYEGGSLSLSDDYFHDNQEGLLGAEDATGSISINHSEFSHNGDGSGSTHNIYVGAIANFSITNSYVHDAVVGHEIKSRAANNTITGNRIFDNDGSASYSVDLPNGGSAAISNNVIEQGAHTQNPFVFAYGEEGITHAGSASISNNTIVNDDPSGVGVLSPTPVSFTGNQVWNLPNLGNVSASNNIVLLSRPVLDTTPLTFITTPPPTHGHGHGKPPKPRLHVFLNPMPRGMLAVDLLPRV